MRSVLLAALAVSTASLLSGCLDFDLAYSTYCFDHCDGGSGGGNGGGSGGGVGGGSGGGVGGGSGGGVGGGSGGGVGGGSGGGSGGGAGGGGGGGTGGGVGGGGGGPYDGGAPCLASDRPRLQCAPPIDLGTDAGEFYGWLSVNDDGLLLAQIRQAVPEVVLKQIFRDGGSSTRQWTTTGPATGVSVSGVGTRWAVSWLAPVNGSRSAVSCVTSAAPGAASTTDAGMDADEVSVSVNVNGGVGIAVRDLNGGVGRMAASATGCPGNFFDMGQVGFFPLSPSGVAAAVMPGLSTIYDFRFAAVEDDGFQDGAHATYGFLSDGGTRQASYFQVRDRSLDISAAMSGDGQNLMMSYVGNATDGGWAMKAKAMPTNLTSPMSVGREIMPDVKYWGSNLCGPACFVTTGVLRAAPVTLRASFISADAVYADLTGTWDIACQRSSSPRNAIPAVVGTKLYVLYTDPARNELYVCDLPPGL